MPDPLDALAARAAEEPFFLGWLLAAHADSEGLDGPGLAAALGCPPQDLTMLYLCRGPAADPAAYWTDITVIAERFGLDPTRLAEAVKRGRVVRRLQRAAPAAGDALLAARDREEVQPDDPGGAR